MNSKEAVTWPRTLPSSPDVTEQAELMDDKLVRQTMAAYPTRQ